LLSPIVAFTLIGVVVLAVRVMELPPFTTTLETVGVAAPTTTELGMLAPKMVEAIRKDATMAADVTTMIGASNALFLSMLIT